MKVDSDELYPYYYLSDNKVYDFERYGEVTLTEEEIKYCKDSEEAFYKYQGFLEDKQQEVRKK